MDSWGAEPWLGVIALSLALGSFAYHLIRVRRHTEPARALISEGLHELSMLLLGLALLQPRGGDVRNLLLGLCLMVFGAYVIRRALARRGDHPTTHPAP